MKPIFLGKGSEKKTQKIIHILRINCTSRNNQGTSATGKIRQNIKFEVFWCVFLTKIKVDPESWQDQEYNLLILEPFQCSFCKYPQLH